MIRTPVNFVFATGNMHKLKEVQALLDLPGVIVRSLKDLDFKGEIVESGSTFEENAWIKADAVYRELGGAVLAEDSGLVVAALDGAPGIYSARYAGIHGDDHQNNLLLLSNMRGINDRQASFVSVLAVRLNDRRYTFTGRVSGVIARELTGTGGFGYDPLFIPDGHDRSFGVLSERIKDQISHRARAFAPLNHLLRTD